MSKENIQEKYFYKREVKIWKNDVRAVSKLGYKGLATQTLIMDLIVESQFQLSLEEAIYEAEWIGLTEADIIETINTYKDLYIEDNLIKSVELQKAVLKENAKTKRFEFGGIKKAVKEAISKGKSIATIAKEKGIDITETIEFTDEQKINYLTEKIQQSKQ